MVAAIVVNFVLLQLFGGNINVFQKQIKRNRCFNDCSTQNAEGFVVFFGERSMGHCTTKKTYALESVPDQCVITLKMNKLKKIIMIIILNKRAEFEIMTTIAATT